MKIFNTFHLKIIALATMLTDHLGLLFFVENPMFRIVGRIAFILYAFMLVEGFFHTKNFKKYAGKLLLWAFLSEIPYDFAIHGKWIVWQHQNVFFTLFIASFGMKLLEKHKEIGLKLLIVLLIFFSAFVLQSDYSLYGTFVILVFYFSKKNIINHNIPIVLAGFLVNIIQFFAVLGLLVIQFYNEKRGRKTGTIFYSFYALHLLILGAIKHISESIS